MFIGVWRESVRKAVPREDSTIILLVAAGISHLVIVYTCVTAECVESCPETFRKIGQTVKGNFPEATPEKLDTATKPNNSARNHHKPS